MKKAYTLISIVLLIIVSSCTKSTPKVFTEADINIIPKPLELTLNQGVFQFSNDTKFVTANSALIAASRYLISQLENAAGFKVEVVKTAPNRNFIQFITDVNLEEEAYKLVVTTNNITITAKDNAGFLYGLETLRQLLPTTIESSQLAKVTNWIIPAVIIKDKPRFKHRGFMLDVSRHFYDIDFVKQTIDRLVMYKMNVLHLHLVDDQGWRIEIKKYPKLTEVGASRNGTIIGHYPGSENDNKVYGGFFTQEDIKEIVTYATERNITVIPEIELPGHSSAAIAAYPYLSCFPDEPTHVHQNMMSETSKKLQENGQIKIVQESWGIYKDIYCAGKDDVFSFLEDVLDEVMPLFPSKYVHIGGDEAIKPHWEVCPNCKKRMKDEGLKDVHGLQSYFVKRIEKYINSKGRKIIGWDEILEGGLAPEATVMSWRGTEGGLEATAQGHDVIMTPASHCYFNQYQGPRSEEPLAFNAYTPLSTVYEFDPVVEGMTEAQANHVLGAQGNLWSEYISTNKEADYMTFPRLAALSEVLWSTKESRSWEDFTKRLHSQFERYDYLGINYAKSIYLVTSRSIANLEENSLSLSLSNEFPNPDIRYVLGDKNIQNNAIKYTDTLKIEETTTIKASLFKDEKPIGKTFIDTIKIHKAFGKALKFKSSFSESYPADGPLSLVNGIRGSKNFRDGQWQGWLEEDMEVVIDLEEQQPIKEVFLGAIENFESGIYFPIAVAVFVSNDGAVFNEVGKIERSYNRSSGKDLITFKINFNEVNTRYIKVIATNLKKSPTHGGGAWLFVDEILVN
ncbi:family 20 glycosylhydrolase [Algibacter amylolyticus]|uniref:beta-N-acetylhexosaminidase n=1 Tax=Algibacter amylolyticus TaxID=1608400 RepID=A0A5M7BAQ1_9FLAO|nr:family 20 glycosylhydrolase [Algibacter amylolyticus]KAA5824491.1 family 20 glycosylhydrolase [Algibacter amylolyticus]MBB5269445.1 hexosaminidase [Algibacter amylolyticus]TSJ75264.1 family 20 glycosylhydrolase [Algibacter amylolyticus]